MRNTLPITKARDTLTDLVDRVSRLLQEVVITVNGKPAAVLLSVDEYESLTETADILSDADLVNKLILSEEEILAGDYITLDDLTKELSV